jgi:hypothetical protein
MSRLQPEHVVDRLPSPDHPIRSIVDKNFGRQRPAIVIRGHCRPVRAGVADRHEVAHAERRQLAVAADDVAAFADRSDDFVVTAFR